MHITALGLAVRTALVASIFLLVGAASADPYKWCAEYGWGREGSATNCGFITLEQCRATISGLGGICQPNPFYTGPDNQPAKRKKRADDPTLSDRVEVWWMFAYGQSDIQVASANVTSGAKRILTVRRLPIPIYEYVVRSALALRERRRTEIGTGGWT